MGKMKSYFTGKLFDINYRLATHEGDANRRLASESVRILLLPTNEVPERHRSEFNKLRRLIENTLKHLPSGGLTPSSIRSIRNSTAAKFIKLLIQIESELHEE
jgi:hypothetical protein